MRKVLYSPTDFPNGFDADQLRRILVTNFGQAFGLQTAADFILLIIDETVDNEINIRAACTNYFILTLAQKDDINVDTFFTNGDKQRKFLLDLFYRVDQRLRILEVAPAITKQQFFNGIKTIYKNI